MMEQYLKCDNIKVFTMASFDGISKIRLNLIRTASWEAAFLQSSDMWEWKDKLQSIEIPSNLALCVCLIEVPNTSTEKSVVSSLAKSIVWNLPVFTFKSLSVYHFTAIADSSISNLFTSSVESAIAVSVLSSAKLESILFSINQKRSFMMKLKNSGPRQTLEERLFWVHGNHCTLIESWLFDYDQ